MRSAGLILLGLLVAVFLGFALWVRLAPDDVARWHRDPAAITGAGKSNAFLVKPGGEGADIASPVYAETPEALLARFRAVALAAPRTSVLSDAYGFLTLIQRSRLMGFPDYISARAVAAEGGAALHIHSRARYGSDDFGVNRVRVLAWLGEL
ncbi:MAG: DUF1499 domain-containing protein [Paracoccaceae bacterium]